MRSLIRAWLAIGLAVSSSLACLPLAAAETCSGFTWDVTRERALFAGAGSALPVGADTASAPLLVPDRLYALQLQPQAKVTFVTAPGKSRPVENSYAGVAALKIATPGAYWIAADAALWIDVVADGGLMSSKAFQSSHECSGPRKIVAFDFPVARQLMLQFSGAASASVRVSITAAGNP